MLRRAHSSRPGRNYIRAKGDYERTQQLFLLKTSSPRSDAIPPRLTTRLPRLAVRSAEKALALMQKRLKDTRVVSPVDGFVQQRFVNLRRVHGCRSEAP